MLPITGKTVGYINEHNKKMASVYRDGEPAMTGNYKGLSGSLEFPIMFRKEDGKWIITR